MVSACIPVTVLLVWWIALYQFIGMLSCDTKSVITKVSEMVALYCGWVGISVWGWEWFEPCVCVCVSVCLKVGVQVWGIRYVSIRGGGVSRGACVSEWSGGGPIKLSGKLGPNPGEIGGGA